MLKEFIPFIDKDHYLVIQLFEFLMSQHQETYSTSEIQNKLQVSIYKTKMVIHDAITLSENLPHTKLTFQNDSLTAVNIDHIILNTVINTEAHQSLRLKTFLHSTLNIYNITDKEFQENTGISSATYFRLKKSIRQEIGVEKLNAMHENEALSRYYIYQLLLYFSYFDYKPNFLDKDNSFLGAKNSIAYMTLIWNINPSNSQRKQINYFIFVNILRSRNQIHLSDDIVNYLFELTNKNELNLFIRHLTKEWQMLPDDASLLTRYYISFLVRINSFPISHLDFLKHSTLIENVTKEQITSIKKMSSTISSKLGTNQFENKLLKTNTKLLNPFFTTELFLTEQHVDYSDLEINQPTDNVINELTSLLCTTSPIKYSTSEIIQIKKTYFLIISPKISVYLLNSPIHIVVDFSDGDIFNDYVKNCLHSLDDLNIQVDQHINALSDIYLTDIYNNAFKKHRIIWQGIPTATDFDSLRNFIIDLQKNVSSIHTDKNK